MRGLYEVKNFARCMLATLRKNRHKGSWKHMGVQEIQDKLREEYLELQAELQRLKTINGLTASQVQAVRNRVKEEALDLACVTMIIVDNVGGLDD